MDNNENPAWDLFRNIVALVRGAEEHAVAVEREACCWMVHGNKHVRYAIFKAAAEHISTVRRYCQAAEMHRDLLKKLGKSSGDDEAKAHWKNSARAMENAKHAETCAEEAYERMKKSTSGQEGSTPVCRMTKL